MMTRDERYLALAIEQAKKAASLGEVPVGAVIVSRDGVIAAGYNKRERDKNPLAHAEIEAIGKAAAAEGDWRLSDCELFVTLEPCAMCAGAIVTCRIKRVVFGAFDPAAGCLGSAVDLSLLPFARDMEVIGGVLLAPCEKLLSDFFYGQRRREKRVETTESEA